MEESSGKFARFTRRQMTHAKAMLEATSPEDDMGIDAYLHWDGQTTEEVEAQYTGFSAAHGHVGYLREAYHGAPYATRVLLPECFDPDDPIATDAPGTQRLDDDEILIPAKVLRERLPAAVCAARERARVVYREPDDSTMVKSLEDFVALAERLEAEGKRPRVAVSY